jgi:hypothetical protein
MSGKGYSVGLLAGKSSGFAVQKYDVPGDPSIEVTDRGVRQAVRNGTELLDFARKKFGLSELPGPK